MQKFYEALREYCKEYDLNYESEHTDRLRKIYSRARDTRLKPMFIETNIVALATRLGKGADYRKEGTREFVRKRQVVA